ncbi:MAG: hypothetical protein NTZ43_02355 [Gemmatimonadetes bacterium]|nr:hypothetical protein [Gemmatimonadota bacterium]
MRRFLITVPLLVVLAAPSALEAQAVDCSTLNAPAADHANMDHAAHQALMQQCAVPEKLPTRPGQAAFGAISEIVGLLKADPKTDWSKVNIEALRQHLIDMDEVTMRSRVAQRSVPGGFEADVTGNAKTMGAIRRMLGTHTKMLSQGMPYRATATEIKGGARMVVVATDANDAAQVARIRGLGFMGMMTEGDHHVRHHLALARGDADAHKH